MHIVATAHEVRGQQWHMLQDNPYGYNNQTGQPGDQSGGTLNNPPTPPNPPVPPSMPEMPGSYSPPEFPSPSSPEPRVINPLNDLGGDSSEPPSYPSAVLPPNPDLGEASPQETGRKHGSKKLLFVLMFILLIVGIIGGGAFALMKGFISNPFAETTPPPIVNETPNNVPEDVTTVDPPQTQPEPDPQTEPPPVQTGDDIRISDLNAIATGLNTYAVTHPGTYPTTQGALLRLDSLGTPCVELMSENAISLCPTDPAGGSAFYGYKSDGTYYELTAKLDDITCSRPGAAMLGTICLYSLKGGLITQ